MGCRLSHITHADEDRLVERGERPTVRRTESKKRHVQAQIEKNGLLSIPLRRTNSNTPPLEARAEAYDALKGRQQRRT